MTNLEENEKTESEKQVIINAVCGYERMQMARAELLLSGSINFIDREAWLEAQVCNDEAIRILDVIVHKIKSNRQFLKDKLN